MLVAAIDGYPVERVQHFACPGRERDEFLADVDPTPAASWRGHLDDGDNGPAVGAEHDLTPVRAGARRRRYDEPTVGQQAGAGGGGVQQPDTGAYERQGSPVCRPR